MKENRSIPSPYLYVLAAVVFLCLGVLGYCAFHSDDEAETVVPEDVAVTDTLALNIICQPTLECLPFYHAVESGLCDSLGLPLIIRTETSQFDIDSIIRRTKRLDGAVLDTYRLQQYRNIKRSLPVTEEFALNGIWRLVVSHPLRVKDVAQLKKRTVASARYSTSSHSLEKAVAAGGLKWPQLYHAQINDYVTLRNMLDGVQVEAAILPEPYAAEAVSAGHRVLWSSDSVSSLVFCMRNKALKEERKQEQVRLLKGVYNLAVKDLNANGVHAADSALIKAYGLPREVIDSLKLPRYKNLK